MSREGWIKTNCARFDHGGCGIKIFVENGKAVRIAPDETHPRSHGYVCPKGMAALERHTHQDRLLYPLRRKGDRGGGQWERITWDQALDEAAESIIRVKNRYGAPSVGFAQGTPKGLEFLVLLRLANVFGSPTVAGTQHVCHMPRELMGRFTCGFMPFPDYESPTSCMVFWGSNPYHTNEEGILGGMVKVAIREYQPKLVVIDPFATEISRKADLWLQIKPGTDDILALGFLHVIINQGWYDDAFVREWTTGFKALTEHVQTYTPQEVAAGTWLREEQIIEAARLYSQSKPALLQWGNAIENNSTNSSQTCRAMLCLMAITGNLDAPGGNLQASRPKLMSPREFVRMDNFPDKFKLSLHRHFGLSQASPLIPSPLMIKAMLTGDPYPIKSLFIQGTNPLNSYAGSEQVYQALKNLDFLMAADLFMTPSAALADLVLPAATNMEFNEIGQYGLPHGYILARPKIVDPPGECWSDMKIFNELGKRLGLGKYFWDDVEMCLDEILTPSGLDYDGFCEQGILLAEKRFYKYKHRGFHTPSGKVELYSSLMEKGGYEPLPTPGPVTNPDETYPLMMTSAKPTHFFHSGYRHMLSLRQRHSDPEIIIHTKTAARYGIAQGELVVVSTKNGSIQLKAVLSDSVHPQVVMADYGWWFPEKDETSLFDWKKSNINILTSGNPPYDPVLGTTAMRGIPCYIEKQSSYHS
jgi:anaerobic selenocysteine-containing dehydrogenase